MRVNTAFVHTAEVLSAGAENGGGLFGRRRKFEEGRVEERTGVGRKKRFTEEVTESKVSLSNDLVEMLALFPVVLLLLFVLFHKQVHVLNSCLTGRYPGSPHHQSPTSVLYSSEAFM